MCGIVGFKTVKRFNSFKDSLGQATAQLHHGRGLIFEVLGDFDGARSDLETALKIARQAGDAWRELSGGPLAVEAVTQCTALVESLAIAQICGNDRETEQQHGRGNQSCQHIVILRSLLISRTHSDAGKVSRCFFESANIRELEKAYL